MWTKLDKPATFEEISCEEVLAQVVLAVAGLDWAVKRKRANGKLVDVARLALARLPYGTNEFAVANRRLDNAAGYYSRGEYGAAAYELRMLQRRLGQEKMT